MVCWNGLKISRFLVPSSFISGKHRKGDQRRKRETEVEGCVIQWPMVYWSFWCLSLILSSQQGAVNWTVFFYSDWRLPSFKLARDIFSRLKWFFPPVDWHYLLKWHHSLSAYWQVTGVKLNNPQCTATTPSTRNKGRGRQMALLSLIGRTNKTAKPHPSMKSSLEGNPLCLKKKIYSSNCEERHIGAFWFWACVKGIMSGHTKWHCYIMHFFLTLL